MFPSIVDITEHSIEIETASVETVEIPIHLTPDEKEFTALTREQILSTGIVHNDLNVGWVNQELIQYTMDFILRRFLLERDFLRQQKTWKISRLPQARAEGQGAAR